MNQQPSIHDIRPIVPLSDGLSWWWVIVVLSLLLLAIGFYWWRKHHQQKTKLSQSEPALPPFAWFEQAMNQLQKIQHDAVAYCFELNFVLREFIERRYRFPATDRTSEEILRDLRRLYLFADPELNTIREFFAITDPVKYAAVQPTQEEVGWLTKTAWTLAKGGGNGPSPL